MKKFIAKLLGVPTKLEFNNLLGLVEELNAGYEENKQKLGSLGGSFNGLQSDMKVLYGEVSSDIKRVDAKIKAVKPILKVEDPEAVTFIKGILSRHDSQIGTQSTAIQTKVLELNKLQHESKKAVELVKQDSTRLNNLLNGLGITESTQIETLREAFKEVVFKKTDEKKAFLG